MNNWQLRWEAHINHSEPYARFLTADELLLRLDLHLTEREAVWILLVLIERSYLGWKSCTRPLPDLAERQARRAELHTP